MREGLCGGVWDGVVDGRMDAWSGLRRVVGRTNPCGYPPAPSGREALRVVEAATSAAAFAADSAFADDDDEVRWGGLRAAYSMAPTSLVRELTRCSNVVRRARSGSSATAARRRSCGRRNRPRQARMPPPPSSLVRPSCPCLRSARPLPLRIHSRRGRQRSLSAACWATVRPVAQSKRRPARTIATPCDRAVYLL